LIRATAAADGESAVSAGIAKRDEALQTVTPTIEVASADEYARRIEAEGGSIIRPKTLIPGIGQLASFKDTEGNVLAILEPLQTPPAPGV
jgi:predicted enzyme related to lactoylglutathione lyase